MTSRRFAESLNIQCLPSSLAATRSIVLLTPNGLPQRMQQNGSSSLSTRAGAVAARKSSCGLSVITFSGQVALHSPHCTQASSAKRSIGRSGSSDSAPVGQADTQDEAQRAALDVDLDRAERRALRQRHDVDRRGRRAMQFAQREPQHVALAADRRESSPGAARRRHRRDRAQRLAERDRDRRSRWWRRGRAPKPSPARIGSASAIVLRKPGDVVARLGAQQEAHARDAP